MAALNKIIFPLNAGSERRKIVLECFERHSRERKERGVNQMEFKEKRIGYLYSVASAFFYALQVVVAKLVMSQGIPVMDLLVIQYTSCTTILGLFVLSRGNRSLFRLERRYWKNMIIQGVVGAAGTSLLMYLAMQEISAGIASMLLYLCPVYVCVFFMITGLRKIGFANKVSMVMAFVGAFMVLNIFGQGDILVSPWGLFLSGISGVTYAFYSVFSDLKLREVPTETFLFYMYLAATVFLWILNPDILINPPVLESVKTLGILVFLALLQVLPMVFLNLGIRAIGSNRATIIATAELPITLILAFLILHETMSAVQLLGIALIVISIVVLQTGKQKNLN